MKNKLNKDFIEKLDKIYNKEEIEIIKNGFNTKRKTIFRINTLKNDFDVLSELKTKGFKIDKIDCLENAYVILDNNNEKISETKSFKQGYIYLQGITSQIPIEIIDFKNKDLSNFKALDLTAAPGGKTSLLSSKMDNKGEIIANELNKIRLEKLKYTIKNQGVLNAKIVNFNALDLYKHFNKNTFDLIIADLPCSAEGRINLEKEKTYKYLEKAGVNKKNYRLQQDIIKNIIELLKVNGELIYSTCTLDPLENEAIVHFILSFFPEMQLVDINNYFDCKLYKKIIKKGITKYKKMIFKKDLEKTIRVLPSKLTEGFYVAKFIKRA